MVARLIYGGISSADYGAVVDGSQSYGAPERDVSTMDVPGRNGPLLIDNGRYLNISITYSLMFKDTSNYEAYRRAMLALRGYQRLEDGRHPTEYRMAYLTGGFAPTLSDYHNRRGTVDITFDCKPQRFLRVGERTIHIAKTGTLIRNPGMPSRPLITVYGNGAGTITVGGTTVSLKETFTGLTLDCDTMDAYMLAANKNADILAPTFPEIPSGESVVSWTDGVTGMDIVPRWWTL